MNTEVIKILLESASGTTILALGIWFIYSKMRTRDGNGEKYEKYVTKVVFYETVEEGRAKSDASHDKTLAAIKTLGDEIKADASVDRQNLFDHVSNHGD